ncbi:hypothetical protein ACKKBG_A35485 [Auxenochlorella protothecoides x Auxenochlorella symbiontica]
MQDRSSPTVASRSHPEGLSGAAPSNPTPHQATMLQRLGQNVNLAGASLFFHIAWRERGLCLPHLDISDLRQVDWAALQGAGFRAAIFDKDNTLTVPYALELQPSAAESLARCRSHFGDAIALFSNSAGLAQFDPEGEEAAALEASLGVPVLRHSEKKPGGGVEDLVSHFGCQPHEMIMVGDRYLTDIVFGNRHGMLTVRPRPFTSEGEPVTVALARRLEAACTARWLVQGHAAPSHPFLKGQASGAFLLQ